MRKRHLFFNYFVLCVDSRESSPRGRESHAAWDRGGSEKITPSSHPRHFNSGVPPPPRGIDTADRSSVKYFKKHYSRCPPQQELKNARCQKCRGEDSKMFKKTREKWKEIAFMTCYYVSSPEEKIQVNNWLHSDYSKLIVFAIVFFVDGRLMCVYVFLMASELVLFKTCE